MRSFLARRRKQQAKDKSACHVITKWQASPDTSLSALEYWFWHGKSGASICGRNNNTSIRRAKIVYSFSTDRSCEAETWSHGSPEFMRPTLAVDYIFLPVEVKGRCCRCSVRELLVESDDTRTSQVDALKHGLRFGVNPMLLPPVCSLSVARIMCMIKSGS